MFWQIYILYCGQMTMRFLDAANLGDKIQVVKVSDNVSIFRHHK